MSKNPLAEVKEKFGSKEALVQSLLPLLDRHDGEDDAQLAKRVRVASNRQLLRLRTAEDRVKAEFGGKDALVDAIVLLKFGAKGNADYRRKLTTLTKTRLLDLHGSSKKSVA